MELRIKRSNELFQQAQEEQKKAKEYVELVSSVKVLEPGDKEYPWEVMCLIDNPGSYNLISLSGLLMVPFYQVYGKLLAIRPDKIIRGNRMICPNCGADMGEVGDKE